MLIDEPWYLHQRERTEYKELRCPTQDLWENYPDSFGRIRCRKAFLSIWKKRRSSNWPEPFYFQISKSKTPVFPAPALDRFKGLVYLLYRLRATHGNQEYVSRLRQEFLENKISNFNFSSEDFAFYLPIIELYSQTKIRDKFAKHIVPKGLASFVDGRYDEFIRQTSPAWYTYAGHYLEQLIEHTMQFAPKDFHLLVDTTTEVLSGLDNLCAALLNELQDIEKMDISGFAPIDGLKVESNISDRRVLENHIDCCITGPKGGARDASVLYRIDPSVDVFHFSPSGMMGDTLPFGMAILSKAKGWHVSDRKKKEYLVLEGFPANQKYCARMGDFKHRERLYGEYTGHEFSLYQFVYMLALWRANFLGIPQLFINVEHSPGAQPSVGYAIREAASFANIPQSIWEFDRHPRKFSLLKDPYTNGGDFEYIDCTNKRLEYTHFLQKPRLSSKLISRFRNDQNWHGEVFFDTWYAWNEFIMATYPEWSDKLKADHPYAEAVWRRGKDPQWNLGIGYCKGFEVDVAKECKRLGIS